MNIAITPQKTHPSNGGGWALNCECGWIAVLQDNGTFTRLERGSREHTHTWSTGPVGASVTLSAGVVANQA